MSAPKVSSVMVNSDGFRRSVTIEISNYIGARQAEVLDVPEEFRVTLIEWDRRVECACSTADHDEDCEKFCGREITARVGFVMANMPGRGAVRAFNGGDAVRAFNGGDYVVFALLDVEKHGKQKAMPSPATVFGGER